VKDREYKQYLRSRAGDINPELEHVPNLEDHIEDFVDADDRRARVVPDRQPVGWISPYGSEDGRSTYFRDLRDELDALTIRASLDPWWAENPHWCAPLHVDMPERVVGSKCGDAQGSQKGYQRHVRAGESACDPCLRAQAEYYRSYRAKRISR